MRSASYKQVVLWLVFFFLLASAATANHQKQEKTVWNYDDGVPFETDGTLPNGVCFRVTGRMSSQDFFDNLRRVETGESTLFRRGTQTVTQFPDSVIVSFAIRDELCPRELRQIGTRTYMTREMMDNLHLGLYWKRGLHLRPVTKATEISSSVEPIVPYARNLAAELPKRYEWAWELAIPSAGVPLTDSLVFVFRTPDGWIAARVAARL